MRKHFSVDLAVQMLGLQPKLGYPLVAADFTAGKVPELDGKVRAVEVMVKVLKKAGPAQGEEEERKATPQLSFYLLFS